MNFSTNDSLECETGQDIPITSPFFNRNLTRFRSVPAPNKRTSEQETRTFRQGAEAIRREIRCKRIAGLEKQVEDDGNQAFIGKLVLRVAHIKSDLFHSIYGDISLSTICYLLHWCLCAAICFRLRPVKQVT